MSQDTLPEPVKDMMIKAGAPILFSRNRGGGHAQVFTDSEGIHALAAASGSSVPDCSHERSPEDEFYASIAPAGPITLEVLPDCYWTEGSVDSAARTQPVLTTFVRVPKTSDVFHAYAIPTKQDLATVAFPRY